MDFLSFLTFFIAYLILLECMIILSIYTDYFFNYFFVLIFSLYCLILSKIILFYCEIFKLNNLCWLVWGTLNETKLWDFLLSISSILLTRARFSNTTGSITSFMTIFDFLYLDICMANSPLLSGSICFFRLACEL